MKRYLITADDYGFCEEVDRAIEDLADKGILSTTNVLMNFRRDFSDSPLIGRPDFSIGIHWNVTCGNPVSDIKDIPTLVAEDGSFLSLGEFRGRYRKGLINPDELELELENQYRLFRDAFGEPEYWNTHENSSLYPKEFRVFEKVALKHNIRCTRNFQRVYIDYDNCKGAARKLREFLVSSYVNIKFGIFEKRKFAMPDGRIVTFVNHSKTDIDRLRAGLGKTKKETVEVIIHPATSGDNPLFGNITSDRVDEYKCFMSDEFYELFQNSDSKIISFNDI